MGYKFFMPTKVIIGKGCIEANGGEFAKLGKKAVIVTGPTSGKKSGALDDVIKVLCQSNINYCVFDKVENNPTIENVTAGGAYARSEKAGFVIGIGGGSPLDAAKAVAVLTVNDMKAEELYKGDYEHKPIPIVAIPTTAGTGSEVTPYSILTAKNEETKKSFTSEDIFPKISFLDASYTANLPHEIAIHTAVDALSHAVEGFLAVKSSPASDYIALESIALFEQCIPALMSGKLSFECREKLLYSSMLAGMVITHSGTTIVHSMGYQLTYFKGVAHGKANGLLMAEYLRCYYPILKDKIETVLRCLKLNSIDEFKKLMLNLIPNDVVLTLEEIKKYVEISINARNVANTPGEVTKECQIDIISKSLL